LRERAHASRETYGRIEARIFETDVDSSVAMHEPEPARCCRRIHELDLDHGSPRRHGRDVQTPMDAPDEPARIQITSLDFARPALAPLPNRTHDGLQCLASARQLVVRAVDSMRMLDDSGVLERR